MTKKISVVTIAFLLSLSLAACQPTTTSTSSSGTSDTTSSQTTDSGTSTSSTATVTFEGDGTEASPYLIKDEAGFEYLVRQGKEVTGYYRLENDISVETTDSDAYESTSFSGDFNGNGKTITLKSDGVNNTGLFYKVTETGKVHDLNVVGHIEAVKGLTGVIVNDNYGTLSGITTKGTEIHHNTAGTVSNGYANGIYSTLGTVGTRTDLIDGKAGAGGIAGKNESVGIIENCYNLMNVRAKVGGGGMAALNYGLINRCFNGGCIGTTGDTASNFDSQYDFSYLGGMAGVNYGTVKECANLNKVYAQRLPYIYTSEKTTINYRMDIGGIAGDNINDTSLTGEYNGGILLSDVNYGRIHGDTRVGGIAGQSNGTIKGCFSSCYFGARYRLGGIVGYQKDDDYGTVDSCMAISRVKSSQKSTITDDTGAEVTVEALDDGKVSSPTTTITDYYCLAKYATHSVYHANCGNEAPIDPNASDTVATTNSTTKGNAAGSGRVETLNYEGSELWTALDTVTSYVPLSKSYQVSLSAVPSWQQATVTFSLNGTETSTTQLMGINVFDILEESGSGDSIVYDKSNSNRNMSGIITGSGAPTADGQTLIWTTVENDASTEWDGVVRGDTKVYSMVVTA